MPCNQLANCVNTIGSYQCGCGVGYSGDGVTCVGKFKAIRGEYHRHVAVGKRSINIQ